MDYLIIQPYYWQPCMETAGDLAMQFREADCQVGFFFLDVDDPFDPVPCGFWPFQAKKKRKASQLERILKKVGIECFTDGGFLNNHIDFLLDFEKLDTIEKIKCFTYDNAPLGIGVISHLITVLSDPYPEFEYHYDVIKKGLIAAIKGYELSRCLMSQKKPKKIIVYNGRFAVSHAIVCAAQKENIPVYYFEEASTFEKFNLFEINSFSFDYIDTLIQTHWKSAGLEREAHAHDFFMRQRTRQQGQRNFAEHQTIGMCPVKTRKRLTYFSSSDDELMCLDERYKLGRSPIFNSQREAIAFLIQWVSEQSDIELVIRVHPHVSKKSIREQTFWNHLSGLNTVLIESSSRIDTYALLDSSDLVLTYGSTLGIEATYWGRTSISLCCAGYSALGCTYNPTTMLELLALLEAPVLLSLSSEKCLPYGCYSNTSGNYVYKYYIPQTWSRGAFCGKHLSMDLWFIHCFKKTFIGRQVKVWRDYFWLHVLGK